MLETRYNYYIETKLQRGDEMKLNLTNSERECVTVTFNVNKFEAFLASGALIGKYASKSSMKSEFAENNIRAKFDGIAQRQYLANYGN